MSTIFPLSASVGQEFDGYMFDGTRWNIIGNEFNPTSFSSNPPSNPQPGDLWVDADSEVTIFDDTTIIQQSDLAPYLTIASASATYATKAELENIDISSASAAAVAAIVDSAPETLNTLNELAAALNDDANYASTVAGQISNLNSGLSQVITSKLDSEEAYSTFLTSASMQTVPVYLMNSGGSAQRPVSASVGMFRFNTDINYPEWYDPETSYWWRFDQDKIINVEYLVVAGGGGGGDDAGGGGGAGGYLSGTQSLYPNTSYTVTVGAGGNGASGAASGSNGSQSTFSSITATGGGGAGGSGTASFVGGSGGGGAWNTAGSSGTAGQGNAGSSGNSVGSSDGYRAGAGGGASSTGSGIIGGNGSLNSITGSALYYAGGGGGSTGTSGTPSTGVGGGGIGSRRSNSFATAGTANTGGGGGGGDAFTGYGPGKAGGSGVVILAYSNSLPDLNISAGLSYTLDKISRTGYKVYKFTQGTGTVSIG